jgi:hypothetical protein
MTEEIIHIGFSKSASTFLQSIFSTNDEIVYLYKSGRFSLLKEGKPLPSIMHSTRTILESDEHIVLPEWHPQLHRVRTTRLKTIDDVFNKIQSESKKPKIILVVRNQYDLLVSRYSQFIVGSGGKLGLHQFIKAMLGNDEDISFYDNYYAAIIHKLKKTFGEGQVHVILYEDLKSESEKIIMELNDFTGLTFKYEKPRFKSQRKGLSAQGLRLLVLINRLLVTNQQPEKSKVKTRVPLALYIFIVRFVRVIDSIKPSEKFQLPKEMESILKRRFQTDNRELEKLVGRKLSNLGYK